MERKIAVQLLDAIDEMSPHIDKIELLTTEIADEAERRDVRKTVAEAVNALGFDLVMRIVRQFPDLDPDKDFSNSKSGSSS